MTVKVLSQERLGLLGRAHLETLLSLSHAFNSTTELDSLLPRILQLTLEVTESEAGAIWLVEAGHACCAVAEGPAAAAMRGRTLPVGHGGVWQAIDTKMTLVVPDALEDDRFESYRAAPGGFTTRSAIVIPLQVNGRGVGAIELVNEIGGKDQFGEEDIAFLEALADDAAAAVRNASLFQAERRAHHFQTELNLFGQLFIIVIVMMAVGIAVGMVMGQGVSPALQVGYSWAAMLIFLIPILAFARRNRLPVSEFGVTLRSWKRHALEGVLFAIPLIAIMPFAKWAIYGTAEPLITFAGYADYPRSLFILHLLFYVPHTYLQELAARGLIQGSLHRFLSDAHPLVPVLVASSLFSVGHLYAGFSFAMLTLFISLVLGLIYMRQRSLTGVTVTHGLCGLAALALGLF